MQVCMNALGDDYVTGFKDEVIERMEQPPWKVSLPKNTVITF